MAITITLRNGRCFFNGLEPKMQQVLANALSYQLPNSFWIRRNSTWDGIVHLFNNNVCSIGLLNRATNVIKEHSEEEIIVNDERKIPEKEFDFPDMGIIIRDYQREAVSKFLEVRVGLLNIAPGGGKTEIALEIFRILGLKALVIVHTKELFNSWVKRIERRLPQARVGRINSYEITEGDITVCMVQSLVRKINNPVIKGILVNTGFVICDECHHIAAVSFTRIMNMCWNSIYRLGLTATPAREDGKDMSITAGVGEIFFTKSINELRKAGFLSNARIKIVESEMPAGSFVKTYSEIYTSGITNNEGRNNKIAVLALNGSQRGNTLVLVNRIEHQNVLSAKMPEALIINSKVDDKRRKEIVDKLDDREDLIVISTQVFDEGVDFPNLKTLILAGGGRSNVKTLQRLGRVLRLFKSEDKVIYDFADKAKFLYRHYLRRKELYEREGFQIVNAE